MFGVVGIPVTELASAAQASGIRYVGFRNEQAAGVAAAAAGFLTGVPAALLTVSGPGLVNALAGAGHAAANGWPLLILSGSSSESSGGEQQRRTGEFQELDQRRLASPLVKWSGRLERASDASSLVSAALKAATRGRPGAVYLDLPSEVIQGSVAPGEELPAVSFPLPPVLPSPAVAVLVEEEQATTGGGKSSSSLSESLAAATALLRAAVRPLAVIGKGAAYGRADGSLRSFIAGSGCPFVATSMGRGVVPDDDPRCCSAARSLALSKCDVAVLFGARLNWQLHFGEAPKWSKSVKFILVDPEPEKGDAERVREEGGCVLRCGAAEAAAALLAALGSSSSNSQNNASSTSPLLVPHDSAWALELSAKAAAARLKVSRRLAGADANPLDYWTALEQIRKIVVSLPRPPVVVSEGANTMDMSRLVLGPVMEARTRLDAGTWGTMGVGKSFFPPFFSSSKVEFFSSNEKKKNSFFFHHLPLKNTGPGCAIAAAVADAAGMTTGSTPSSSSSSSSSFPPQRPRRRVLAVEGDSAFGFSLAEVETAARFRLPITFVVFNNGGVYGGDRRTPALISETKKGAVGGGFQDDPPPTAFVAGVRHDLIGAAFGARAFLARDAAELGDALRKATLGTAEDPDPGTCVIDVVLDPMAGVESGSVHGFNAPAAASL